MKKINLVKWVLIFAAGVFVGTLVGCASDTPRNPMVGESGDIWWRTPYTSTTPRAENPWLAYVKDDQPNEFDPWANNNLQQYSVSPVISSTSVAPVRSTVPVKRKTTLEEALDKNIQDFLRPYLERRLREHRERQSPRVY